MAEYKIGKKQEFCSACGKMFEDGEEVVSCIYPEGDSFGRADLCMACWEADKAPPEHISYWRRKAEKKEQPKVFNRRAAFDLFKVLADSEDPQDADTSYILAILLMRKGVFDLVRTGSEQGVSAMVLKLKSTKEEFKVPNRELSEERLQQIKDNLESIFEEPESAS